MSTVRNVEMFGLDPEVQLHWVVCDDNGDAVSMTRVSILIADTPEVLIETHCPDTSDIRKETHSSSNLLDGNYPDNWDDLIPPEVQTHDIHSRMFMALLMDIVDKHFHKGKYWEPSPIEVMGVLDKKSPRKVVVWPH